MAEIRREFILLGTATSVGVPVIGCDCEVCRSPNPRNHRTRTGVAVQTPDGVILIDSSPELRLQLIRERIPLAHSILFTHGHADHMFGLDDTRLFALRLKRPFPIYCEEWTENNIRAAFSYAFKTPPPEVHPGAIPQFAMHRIGVEPFDVLGQRIQPIRLMHGRLPILGFRFNDVAFCTDVSRIPDESWPLLQGLDVLVLDTLREQPHPTHLCVAQSLEIIEKLKPKRAYLTHLSHSLEYETMNAKLPGNVQLAYDGLRIPY